MHQKENGQQSARGLALKKRAKKKAEPQQDPLVTELLVTVRELQKAQSSLVEQVLVMQQEQAKLMTSWFEMWKPPTGQNTATGLDQRLLAKEVAEQATEWDPLNDDEMLDILKMVGTGR